MSKFQVIVTTSRGSRWKVFQGNHLDCFRFARNYRKRLPARFRLTVENAIGQAAEIAVQAAVAETMAA